MKNYLLFFICVFSLPVLSQNGISIAVNYIQPMVTNFDNETKNYENPVDLYNLKSTVSVQVYRDEHFLFRMGLSYKFLDLILRDVMDSISYSQPSIKDHSLIYYPRTHYFNEDKPDYHNRSNSIGLHLDMSYLFGKSKNHSAGVEMNYYFFEYYMSSFTTLLIKVD